MFPHSNCKSVFRSIRHRCCVAAGTALLAVPVANVDASISWPPQEPVQKQIESAIELIGRLQTVVPEPHDNMTDRAFGMDFDYDTAIRHVTESIHYEPYRGVLRGPDGAYDTSSGNAWDQATLLAGLIKTIGGDAQIVTGTLSTSDARRLLQQIFEQSPPRGESTDLDAIAEIIGSFDPEMESMIRTTIASSQDADAQQDLQETVDSLSRQIHARLADAGVEIENAVSVIGLVDAVANDYAWVRWRLGPGSEWQELHPAFGNGPSPEVEPQGYLDESVPQDRLHRVAFQLFIERGRPDGVGDVERVAVMSRWERPTANLYKNQISLGMGPIDAADGPSSATVVPMLNGSIAPGAMAVNRLGLTADPADAATSAGKFLSTLSNRGAEGAASLSGMQEEGEAVVPRLIGVVLKVEIISPDQSTTVERRLVDLRGEPKSEFPASASFGMVFDVDIGADNGAELYHRLLDYQARLLKATPALLALARGALDNEAARNQRSLREFDQALWLDFDLLSDAFLEPDEENVARFRNGPLVAGRRTVIGSPHGIQSTVDIISNPVTVMRSRDDGLVSSPRDAVSQGVRETLLESFLAGVPEGWANRAPSEVILSEQELRANEHYDDWPLAGQERATDDLKAGYALALVEGKAPFWWRIHRGTGETLGMGPEGGQEVAEYIFMVSAAALSAFLFKQSVESCDETYADNQEMADCCIVGNLLVTYGSAAAGGATGGLPSGPAMAYWHHPYAASAGYITAALQFETAKELAIGAMTEQPIENACRAYLENR